MTKRPNSLRHLDDAIRRTCGGSSREFIQARTLMANTIVASLLPDGVIKGGSAIKMRFGDAATRFTTDLDTATATDPKLYIQQISRALEKGWEGFSGYIVERESATPNNVPEQYIMQPFDIKLTYMGKSWCTVPLEVGHNEIGDADKADWVELDDAVKLFEAIGFPAPNKVPLMTLGYQIAQKLHAVSSGGDRARDLVDLQLIADRVGINYSETRNICERLFIYRKMQPWPPIVSKGAGWEELYAEQASDLPVLKTVDEAIVWVNDFISKICGE